MAQYLVGVDLGGTKILTARCGLDGVVQQQVRVPTPAVEGIDAVLGCMVDSVAEVLAEADPAGLLGVGVGAPGPIDPVSGLLYVAPNLPGWENVPLRNIMEGQLAARIGRPVRVITGNDANAAALGEYYFSLRTSRPDVRHFVYITVSTGVGGGVIADGRLFTGARGLAGEIGHITVDMNGPSCNCGNIGCIEAIAAGPAIARQAVALLAAGRAPLLARAVAGDHHAVTPQLVYDAARHGDPDALALLHYIGKAIGVLVVNVLHTYNPQVVVIGGGIAKMGDLLLDPMHETVRAQAIPAFLQDLQILPAKLGDQIGVLGAAALVLQ